MTSADLLNTLDDLKNDEFKKFKWYLQYAVSDILEGYQPIKVSKLETAERCDTVGLMVNTYKLHGALKVTKKVLEEINRNDLVQSLSDTSSGPEGGLRPVALYFPGAPGSNSQVRKEMCYNYPGASGVKLLCAGLDTLRVEHGGEQRLKPGVRKYACELTLDTNTAYTHLKLSDNNRKVTVVRQEQPYPDHPERFDCHPQLLCRSGLTGRCYWEVEWREWVYVSVSYRGIRRKGYSEDCVFGQNDQSWSLFCSDGGYSVCHDQISIDLPSSSVSNRVGVYVDCPAGTLSFYRVSSDSLIHLHTFNTTFTEPLYPGFGFGFNSSVSLCSL